MLTANRIAVSFGGVRAVDDVSLDVATGTIVGLIGPNGSGKSTFLNAVCGLVPARGRVEVDNHRVRLGDPRHSWSARIIRTFQTPQVLASLTCMENVAFTSRDRGWSGAVGALVVRPMMLRQERARWARAAAALDRVGLADYAQVPAGQLSYGRRRLLELARVINAQPLVLLLDEPTAGLNDIETAGFGDLLKGLRNDGISMLLVDHKVDFIDSLCERIVVLELGQVIASDTPDRVWSQQRVVDAYLGVDDADG
jgi:branched-chain amino acid transport system ATP-binding protein